MNAYEFFSTFPKGAEFMVEYRSDVKITAAGKKDGITSITKIVIDKTHTGLSNEEAGGDAPKEGGRPCWWHHEEGHEHRIAVKNSDETIKYGICAPFENKVRHTTYVVNGGKIVSFDWLLSKGYVYAPTVEDKAHTILLKLENIIAINGELCS